MSEKQSLVLILAAIALGCLVASGCGFLIVIDDCPSDVNVEIEVPDNDR